MAIPFISLHAYNNNTMEPPYNYGPLKLIVQYGGFLIMEVKQYIKVTGINALNI